VALATPRSEHTTTLLANGRLLVAGGRDAQGRPLASAEVLDLVARTVDPTTGPLLAARAGHTATRLPSGRVLIAGGLDESGAPIADAELYDPTLGPLGAFVATAPLDRPRAGHRAVVLCDGAVLFVGGGPGASVYQPAP
jgi:hypothetical protein